MLEEGIDRSEKTPQPAPVQAEERRILGLKTTKKIGIVTEKIGVYRSNCRLRPLSKPLYIRARRQLNGFNTKSAIEKSLWVKLQAVIYLQGR